MASLRCLSCFIFRRADLIAFFAIVIHFDKVFVFSFENFEEVVVKKLDTMVDSVCDG